MVVSITSQFDPQVLNSTQAQIARAMRSSLSYLIRSLEAKAAMELSADLQVQLKIARSRLRSIRNNRGNKDQAVLSGSLHSLPAILVGKASKAGSGLKVGSRYFNGGFIARSQFSSRLPKRVFHRTRRRRFPLAEDRVNIEKEVSQSIIQVSGLAFGLFRKRFEHELRYRVQAGRAR